MADQLPPAAAYVNPAGITVSARFAAQLMQLTDLGVVRRRRRGADACFDQEAFRVHMAALWYREQQATGSDPVPSGGSDDAQTSEPVAGLTCTTSEVAAMAGVGVRAVVKAIHEHRLPATWSGSRWLVAAEDAERFMTSRGEQ